MDNIKLDLNGTKRIHSINISQSMNLRKLMDDYIQTDIPDKTIDYLYIGMDEEYSLNVLKTENYFQDFFEVTDDTDRVTYTLIRELPDVDVLFVILDGFPDNALYDIILHNTNVNTHVIYLYDSSIADYSDGDFYKNHTNPDCYINTFNRRNDIKLAISTLLNKLKKYNYKYINDPELTHADECCITYENITSDELLDYDKIILVNHDDCSEYTTTIRKLLARGFAPEPRDKMINYQPIDTTYYDEDTRTRCSLHIPAFSELTVKECVCEPDINVPPTYLFEYKRINRTYEVKLTISLGFIEDLNGGLVDHEVPITYRGNKLYYGYVLPIYAVTKRYDNVLLVVDDSVLNKDTVYTAISYVKERFKMIYGTNVYMG